MENCGPIPKDKYNHVWNNFHFHVENFYDYLHLDREARDLDFKHNLEQNKIVVLKNWLTKLTSTKRFENFKIYTEFGRKTLVLFPENIVM
jgi:hypothetical protein